MSKLYLQTIIDDISFDNLSAKWQGFDFARFSKDKTLFDFQKQGLQNALKGLWLYFKDKKEEKQNLYNHYLANDFTENFDYDLKKREGKKTAKHLLEYDKDYPAIDGYSKIFEIKEWKSKTFPHNGLYIDTKLLLKPQKGIAAVLDNYKKYWFDNFDELQINCS